MLRIIHPLNLLILDVKGLLWHKDLIYALFLWTVLGEHHVNVFV
jgi:hypothetical protein